MQGGGNASERVVSNQYAREKPRFKLPKILEKLAHEQVQEGEGFSLWVL
jgi:hypothetical protein